jgi:DnaK suppressor protein
VDDLDSDQLAELQALLRHSQQELQLLLKIARDSSEPVSLDQQAFGRVSRVDAIQQQQIAKANQDNNKIRLARVIAALDAVQTGDYGYCEHCGESIAYARLKAQPAAVLCLSCQTKSEQS